MKYQYRLSGDGKDRIYKNRRDAMEQLSMLNHRCNSGIVPTVKREMVA